MFSRFITHISSDVRVSHFGYHKPVVSVFNDVDIVPGTNTTQDDANDALLVWSHGASPLARRSWTSQDRGGHKTWRVRRCTWAPTKLAMTLRANAVCSLASENSPNKLTSAKCNGMENFDIR
ncbi:hypothetical protein EVAR_69436_1 [Eumeta japonica]|uniref:Uncharacterized protein n=1 Tax=Eumeta variegata TaxID=151549 RepID=A0A4C2AAW7_EUMVA|nr:hypothetical protein EVAR_69436_1 [Eumeta japonica]